MSIDLDKERPMTLNAAADLLSQLLGIRFGYKTAYSWSRYGIKRVKLDSIRIGGSLFTSREAVIDFVRAVLQMDSRGYDCFQRMGVNSRACVAAALAALEAEDASRSIAFLPRLRDTESNAADNRIRGGLAMEQTIYEAAGGSKAFLDLAHAWHARCLADPVVSHAFSHGYHPQHAERLAAYWAEALGGPCDYTNSMGDESFVVRLHSGNGKHEEMDERAQTCFARALDDAGLPRDAALRATLKAYFRWATTAMAAFPDSADDVPPGLAVPRWSWEGPVSG